MARSVSTPTIATRSAVSTKSTSKSSLPKYTPKVNSSINNYIRKITSKHLTMNKISQVIYQNISIVMVNLKVSLCMILQTIIQQ